MANLYDKASLVLPVSPAYKDGVIQAYKPLTSEGTFNFSRGSNLAATRVNSDGLIEKGRENLLLQSNQFDTTWVQFQGASVTGGQAGYDGSSNAWKLNVDSNQIYSGLYQAISGSYVGTQSIYAKAGTLDTLGFVNMSGSNFSIWFDLTNGTIGTQGGSNIDASIESVGNGWYRLSVTQSGAKNFFQIKPSDGENLPSSFNGYIYIQDAQLEQGLVATDYIKTTTTTAVSGITEDLPRLDYSGGASCPSLLLEPQRSNLVTQSEYINSSTYVTGNWTGTITNNTNETLSPEGVYNATKFVKSGASDRIYFQTSVSDGTYTGSMYFKAVSGQEGNTIEISVRRFGGGSGSTTKLITLTNEWQRVDVTATLSGGSNTAIYIADFSSSGNATEFYFYGLQLESNASYPSSYIPTYGSSVTRSADSCSKTGISSLIGQTEGTLFVDGSAISTGASVGLGDSGYLLAISDNTLNNQINIRLYPFDGVYYIQVRSGGSVVAGTTYTPTSIDQNVKIAIAYKANDFAFYVNGTQIATASSGAVPALSVVNMGQFGGTLDAIVKTKQALLFKERLSNTQLAALTTL